MSSCKWWRRHDWTPWEEHWWVAGHYWTRQCRRCQKLQQEMA